MDKIPILKMGKFLLITLQVDLHDKVALALQDDVSNMIAQSGAKGVLIDISGLELDDSFIGRVLGTISSISRLLDANTVLVGMRPAVAITMLELGLSLQGMHTALNVEDGMELLNKITNAPRNGANHSRNGNHTKR